MNINIIYDSSVNNAPSGFQALITAAVQFLDSVFSNTATINIDVGWGEVDGQSLGSNDLGQSNSNYVSESYSAVRSALLAASAPGASTLPLISPLSSTLTVSTAEAQALGLLPNSGSIDGYIGFSSILNTFGFSAGSAPPASEYYLLGVIEHEITEVMGRVSMSDAPMDLFRYSSPGVRSLHAGGAGSTAYFSIDNGTTNLGSWNNNSSNGDLGDWYPSGPAAGGNDAFNDYSSPGVINVVSANDITLMDALGWGRSATSLAGQATVQSLVAVADNLATNVNAGRVITITATTNEALTVTGTPTLQLNDNEVALYTSGSGTNSLKFTYTVQPGDNVSDLFATGLNLPSGAMIVDSVGNAPTTVSGDLHLTVNATTPPATTVQQEILGLYAALYGRAADFPGYSYWLSVDSQQTDSGGVSAANAGTTAVTLNDAQLLGQLFVNTQSSFFNATYGVITDSQFINALYVNIGGNTGDPTGIAYWSNLLAQAEAGGESAQTARAGIVGQFVHDLIDYNLSTQPAGLTTAQYQAALMRQATIDNKIAVSLAYLNASQQTGGSILDPHTIGDSAYNASVTALHAVTNDGTTADVAIAGIQLAIAQQNLLNIV